MSIGFFREGTFSLQSYWGNSLGTSHQTQMVDLGRTRGMNVSLFLQCQEHFGFYCWISKTIPNRTLGVPTSCCRSLGTHKALLHGSPRSNTLGWQCLNGQTSSGWWAGLSFLAKQSSLPLNDHSKWIFMVFKIRNKCHDTIRAISGPLSLIS